MSVYDDLFEIGRSLDHIEKTGMYDVEKPEFATLFTIIKLLLKTKSIDLFIIFRLFYIDF